jgi:curved DNA-binding protein CbpA
MDPYDELKVKDNVSDDDVKKAFKRAMIKYHPDKVQNGTQKIINEEKFKKAQQAYDEIILFRKYKNINLTQRRRHNDPIRRSYHDLLYTMFSKDNFDLIQPSFLDINKNIFDEIEESMKAMHVYS